MGKFLKMLPLSTRFEIIEYYIFFAKFMPNLFNSIEGQIFSFRKKEGGAELTRNKTLYLIFPRFKKKEKKCKDA